MHKLIASILIFTACGTALAAEKKIEGRLEYLNPKTARINGVSYAFNPRLAECLTEGHRVTCETLLGVGYADQVVAIVNNNAVTKLDVTKLSQ